MKEIMKDAKVSGNISVDHVGYTVSDLDKALDLFINVFGCELVFKGGPYDDAGYVWPGEDKPAETPMRCALITHGGTTNIELLEYDNPSQSEVVPPRPNERGGTHMCFFTENIEDAAELLRHRDDVLVMGNVEKEIDGAIGGADWIYTVTTWGLVIELMRWEPGTLPYEKTTEARLISPPWYKDRLDDPERR